KAAVYTFDPGRKVLARGGSNPNHLNIITKGDPVSDARAAKLGVPGRTVRVDLPPTLSPVKNRKPDVILSRISSLARTARSPAPHAPRSGSASPGAAAPALARNPCQSRAHDDRDARAGRNLAQPRRRRAHADRRRPRRRLVPRRQAG